MLKNAVYSSVNVFSNKLLIEDNIFKTAILRPEPSEGLAVFRLKAVPLFLSYFKTLSIGLLPGMEPATSRSVVKYSTDWANKKLVLIINNLFIVGQLSLTQAKMKGLLEFLQSQLPWLAISWSRSIRFLLLCQSFQHKVYTSEEKQKEQFNM